MEVWGKGKGRFVMGAFDFRQCDFLSRSGMRKADGGCVQFHHVLYTKRECVNVTTYV